MRCLAGITVLSSASVFTPATVWAAASGGTTDAGYLARLLMGLLLVIGAILLLSWLLKRLQNSRLGSGSPVKVLGGVMVGQRERVVLIQAGEQQLLLGVAPGSVRALQKFDQPVVSHSGTDQDPAAAGGFPSMLNSRRGDR